MKRTYLFYGTLIGLVALVLRIFISKVMIRDVEVELFGAFIAMISAGLGIWVGINLFQRSSGKKLSLISSELGPLSKREKEVLQLLAAGHSNQQIADKLFVSLNTIKTHLSKIYQKLNAQRRTQAIQKAIESGLVIIEKENHPKV